MRPRTNHEARPRPATVALSLSLSLAVGLVACLLSLAGCVSDRVTQVAETVLTLQSGTISELRDRRGSGPYRTYPFTREEMLTIVEAAARKARGAGDEPVRAVFVYERAGEVIAKERSADEADDDAYDGAFRTALYAAVLPVIGDRSQSRVEIHAIDRGPFHKGVVRWARDMPRWIDEVIAERAAIESGPIAPLPK
jgi:hypothetical protein